MTDLATPEEALLITQTALAGAVNRKRWMAAVWELAEDGTVKLTSRVTSDFPIDGFMSAQRLLAKELADEVSRINLRNVRQ